MSNIINQLHEMYYSKSNPKGWVIGKEVETYLINYLNNELSAAIDKDKYEGNCSLMGLPYIVDTENETRIEIIA